MRNVASVLGVVVSAVLAGCGGKSDTGTAANATQSGTLKPDGTTTPAEHRASDSGCMHLETWDYVLDPSFTCDAVHALATTSTCTALCGQAVSNCQFVVQEGTSSAAPAGPDKPAASACPPMPTKLSCLVVGASAGTTGNPCAIEGRRPDGLRAHVGDAYGSLAGYFANAAHLEAAAVLAFERLGEELRGHGAPEELLARVAQAEKEERRHVVLASGLARRFGAEPPPAVAESTSRRTLFAIARENVIEGVVRETFGAAVAIHRARRAADAEVRETLAVIAADECRHAELSWDLHEWMTARLTEEERAGIEAARLDALRELGDAIADAEPPVELAVLAGVPTRRDAMRLFDAVSAVLWRAAA